MQTVNDYSYARPCRKFKRRHCWSNWSLSYDATKVNILWGCVNSGSGTTTGESANISEGAVYYNGEVYYVPAFSSDVVDTTGAGDAFLAGYITAVAMGKDLASERLFLGATWAALAVESESSIPPNWSEVEKVLNR